MKSLNKIFSFLFLVVSSFLCYVMVNSNTTNEIVVADGTNKLTCEVASDNLLNDNEYVSFYKLTNDLIESYSAIGGGTNLSNAFDGNWNTYWQTATENSGTFKNDIVVNFKTEVIIDRILYASSSARLGHGYPTILNIYIASSSDDELELYGTVNSSATNSRVVFYFDSPQVVKSLKFEFYEVNTMHNWVATCKELQFLTPESAECEVIRSGEIFTDYTQTSLADEYKSTQAIDSLAESTKDLPNFDSAISPILDRARAIIDGYVTFDTRREFSTSSTATNQIMQWGDMRAYASNTLQMSSFGINRQVSGIAGLAGEQIVIYVEADEGDPLPSIAFTQSYGAWQSWKSEVKLSRGKNVFTFPNLITSNYSKEVVAGGPIHIINPYLPSEQSSNVKIYIEGGNFYPVFRDGDDETSFKMYLEDYTNKLNDASNLSVQLDVFEVVCDSVILSSLSSLAYNSYIVNGNSPQKNCDTWNDYMYKLITFAGVSFDENDENYNERNTHLYTNIRVVQPWPGAYAFAADDHIGIIDSSTFHQLVNKAITGWAFAHEIGHALDNNQRTWGEVTNNMWAYYDALLEGDYDRLPLNQVYLQLSSDFTLTNSAFQSFGDNCVIWMSIEAGFPGYWGNLENKYRFETTGKNLGRTERMIYYSSLATGYDLSSYFERWGFYMNSDGTYSASNRFTTGGASSTFTELMQEAIASNKINTEIKKLWYLDTNQFVYLFANDYKLGDWASLYNENTTTEILEIVETNGSYTLYLPDVSDIANLGYEISVKIGDEFKVVGFTYGSSFTDTTSYDTTPTYKVCAYDRCLNTTAYVEKSYIQVSDENVCMVNDTYFNSISDAVSSASAGDTIYLLKSTRESGIVIDKNLTLTVADGITEDIIIYRLGIGDLFVINSGATLTAYGTDNAKLIIDGDNITQSGTLISVSGTLIITGNTILQNNICTGSGGAIFAKGEVRLTNVEIRNNKAVNGGAVSGNNVRTYYTNVVFSGNTATSNGGAIYNIGTIEFINCNFISNTASSNGGAICNTSGGVITLTNTSFLNNFAVNGGGLFADGKSTLNNTTFSNNTASSNGGAIYSSCSNSARVVYVYGGNFSNNTSNNGSLFYLNNGEFNIGRDSGTSSMPILSGEIYISGANLTIHSEMFDSSNVTFVLQSISNGKRLFAVNGFSISDEVIQAISVKNAVCYKDSNIVRVNLAYINLIVSISGNETIVSLPVGEITLDESLLELSETDYVSSWVYNSTTYQTGDVIEVYENSTIFVTLGKKLEITLTDDAKSETVYVKPNEFYYLPLYSPSGDEVIMWKNGALEYLPATSILVTENVQFVATKINRFTILFKDYDGSIISSTTYKYGDTVFIPASPTREGDENCSYEFAGWSPNAITICTGNAEYIATYNTIYKRFTVIFKNYDGSILSETIYNYGDRVIIPSDPTRPSDKIYEYLFSGWDKVIETTCTGNAEYTATYSSTFIEYKIVFKDYDETVLSENIYHYGDRIVIPNDPTRPSDNVYNYVFMGWTPEVEKICTGSAEYMATYEGSLNMFSVVFRDYNDFLLSVKLYNYGETIELPSDPTRVSDNVYSYEFVGWSPEVELVCTGIAEYKAVYREIYIDYTVVFKDYDGEILSQKTYHYGDTIIVPNNPNRESDEKYNYSFSGWDKVIENSCTGNAEYTATYSSSPIEYTIIFKNYDGTILSENVYNYGETIELPSDPARPSDGVYDYIFSGWDMAVEEVCTGNANYTATYERKFIEYKIIFKNFDNSVISEKTYHYGDEIIIPETPTKVSDEVYRYVFNGWTPEVSKYCTESTSYTATFISVLHTSVIITVENGTINGSNENSQVVQIGDVVTLMASPAEKGKVFVGFYNGTELLSSSSTYTFVASEDILVVAVYQDQEGISPTIIVIIIVISVIIVLITLTGIITYIVTKKKKIQS